MTNQNSQGFMKKTEANGSVGGGEPETEEVIFCAAAISTSLSIFDGPIFKPFLTGLDWPLFCVALQPS